MGHYAVIHIIFWGICSDIKLQVLGTMWSHVLPVADANLAVAVCGFWPCFQSAQVHCLSLAVAAFVMPGNLHNLSVPQFTQLQNENSSMKCNHVEWELRENGHNELRHVPRKSVFNVCVFLSSPCELSVRLLYFSSVRFHLQKLYFKKRKRQRKVALKSLTSSKPLSPIPFGTIQINLKIEKREGKIKYLLLKLLPQSLASTLGFNKQDWAGRCPEDWDLGLGWEAFVVLAVGDAFITISALSPWWPTNLYLVFFRIFSLSTIRPQFRTNMFKWSSDFYYFGQFIEIHIPII